MCGEVDETARAKYTMSVGNELFRTAEAAITWILLSVVVGRSTHGLSVERLTKWEHWLRLFPWEEGGRVYDRYLRIRVWKRYLPEGGNFFRGGIDKRQLPQRDQARLERFVIETERAEFTHWILLVVDLAPLWWMRSWLGFIVLGYVLIANIPCLVTQRYNRARLLRYLERRRPRI